MEEWDSLWYEVLIVRYGGLGSVWWRNIKRIRKGVGVGVGRGLIGNIRRVVGGGASTLFWNDLWVGDTDFVIGIVDYMI